MVTNTLLNNLRVMFSTLFKKGLDGANKDWEKVATLTQSNNASNVYSWLSKFPSMRQWIGDRVVKQMKESAYSIPNEKYEATVEVSREDMEDDNLGTYGPLMESMGQEAQDHINRLIFAALKGGFSAPCYDGQYFFDTDHPVYPEVDGTGEAVTTSNIIAPETTTEPAWFLLDTSRVIKPIIYQERTKPELEAITTPSNEAVFNRDVYPYGIRARRGVGYSFWQFAVASKAALTVENYEAARAAMMSFKKDGGDPLGIRPTTLVVSSENEAAAKKIIKAINLDNGQSNIHYKEVEIVCSSWL
ncbi:MAG: Mu-like prophage major head subunit gpT family protein [Pleomorphochaeta sp.]